MPLLQRNLAPKSVLHFVHFIGKELLSIKDLTPEQVAILRSPVWMLKNENGNLVGVRMRGLVVFDNFSTEWVNTLVDEGYLSRHKDFYWLSDTGIKVNQDRHLSAVGRRLLLLNMAGREQGFTVEEILHQLRTMGVNRISASRVMSVLDELTGDNVRGISWLETFSSDGERFYRLTMDGMRVRILAGASLSQLAWA